MAGLLGKDEEFWVYVCKFDFIEPMETWIDAKSWERYKRWLPKGYV